MAVERLRRDQIVEGESAPAPEGVAPGATWSVPGEVVPATVQTEPRTAALPLTQPMGTVPEVAPAVGPAIAAADQSSRLRSGGDLLGLPVFSIAEGKRLGEIKGLHVQRDGRRIGAISVGGAGVQTHFIPCDHFRVFGQDISLVDSASTLENGLASDQVAQLDTGLSGRPVITRSGLRVGEVIGFTVEVPSGRIVAYQVRPETSMLSQIAAYIKGQDFEIRDSSIAALGPDALIVGDEVATALGVAQPGRR